MPRAKHRHPHDAAPACRALSRRAGTLWVFDRETAADGSRAASADNTVTASPAQALATRRLPRGADVVLVPAGARTSRRGQPRRPDALRRQPAAQKPNPRLLLLEFSPHQRTVALSPRSPALPATPGPGTRSEGAVIDDAADLPRSWASAAAVLGAPRHDACRGGDDARTGAVRLATCSTDVAGTCSWPCGSKAALRAPCARARRRRGDAQGIFRNALVEPGLLGVSNGAALGAVAAIVLGARIAHGLPPAAALWLLPGAAFAAGLASLALAGRLGRVDGRAVVAALLLAGIAVNALTGAFVGLLTFLATDAQLRTLTFWTLGSLGGATWPTVLATAVPLGLALVLLPREARRLDALVLGEAERHSSAWPSSARSAACSRSWRSPSARRSPRRASWASWGSSSRTSSAW